MQEVDWTRKAPAEIKILSYVYVNGGVVEYEKGVGSYVCREIGIDTATQTNSSRKLANEGVLYRHPGKIKGRFDRYELAGHWEQYEPAIKMYLGIEDEGELPFSPQDTVPTYVDSRIIESELEKDNQIATALKMYHDADWENRKLRRVLEYVLPLVNASKIVDLLMEDVNAKED